MSNSTAEWYYAVSGQQAGPVPMSQLQTLAASGQLHPGDLVWSAGMANWQPAASIEGLFPHGAAQAGYPAPGGPALAYYTPPSGEVRYAGFWIRFCSWIIDWIITFVGGAIIGGCFGFFIGLGMGAGGTSTGQIEAIAQLVGNLLGIVLNWLYEALMESSPKQATLGKMAVGIVVVDGQGQRISFARATGRHFAKYISGLTLMIGFMMAGWTQRKQALHDLIASTYVVFGRR